MLLPKNKQKELVRVTLASHKTNIYMEQYVYEAGYFRFNWHDCHEILLVLEGSLTVLVEGSQFQLDQHDVLVINPQQAHATMQLVPHTTILLMHLDLNHFSPANKKQTISLHCQSNPETRNDPVFSFIRYHMANIYMELSLERTGSTIIADGSLKMLYGLLLRHFTDTNSSKRSDSATLAQIRKLKSILAYTEKNFMEKIKLQDLADITGMNYSYVSTFFHAHTGTTYYEYLTRIRLRHAVHSLNNSDTSVLEIALDSGFPDAKALNTTFKHYFNTTPDRYRKTLNRPDVFIDPLPTYLKYPDPRVQRLIFSCLDEQTIRSFTQ